MNCTESELLKSNEQHNDGYDDCPGTNKKENRVHIPIINAIQTE